MGVSMSDKEFDIQDYMSKGVANVMKNAVRATLKNPKEAIFMAEFAAATSRYTEKRKKAQKNGEHIPAFLISDDAARDIMQKKLAKLREEVEDIVFVSFPGDEKSSGGCVAAGRGFFHINSHGGAESINYY